MNSQTYGRLYINAYPSMAGCVYGYLDWVKKSGGGATKLMNKRNTKISSD